MRDVTPEPVLQRATTGPPILLVEDDASQALLIERVLAKAGLINPVRAFSDGQEALLYLGNEESHSAAQIPALVLLDLHLPGKSGLEILEWLRQHQAFRNLPVIMLSGSTESEDIDRAFQLGADSYLVKPVAFDALVDAVTGLDLRWMIVGRKEDLER